MHEKAFKHYLNISALQTNDSQRRVGVPAVVWGPLKSLVGID